MFLLAGGILVFNLNIIIKKKNSLSYELILIGKF